MKKTEQLLNGITLITHQLQHLHSVRISVSFRTGSLYENEYNSGISHITEHLFFRRLSDLPQDELYFEMQKIGDEIYGATCFDYVTFNITVVSRHFEKALDLMLKYFDKFDWTESELSQEREVVFREIETSGGSYEKWIRSYYFEDTKYSVPIMGTKESVTALSLDEINSWKNEYFTPQNSCVVVTGNFTDDEYNLLKNRLNNIESYGETKERILELPKDFENRNPDNNLAIEETDNELTEVVMLVDINEKYDYESVRLLKCIFEGCSGKLSMAMREKVSFTYDIYSELLSYIGFYRLSFSYTVRNEVLFESLNTLIENIKEAKTNITEKEYISSIAFLTDNMLMELDDCRSLNNEYYLCDFVFGNRFSTPDEKAEKYSQLTTTDLIKTANDIFVSKNVSFIIETSLDENEVREYITKLTADL